MKLFLLSVSLLGFIVFSQEKNVSSEKGSKNKLALVNDSLKDHPDDQLTFLCEVAVFKNQKNKAYVGLFRRSSLEIDATNLKYEYYFSLFVRDKMVTSASDIFLVEDYEDNQLYIFRGINEFKKIADIDLLSGEGKVLFFTEPDSKEKTKVKTYMYVSECEKKDPLKSLTSISLN